jgi:hypothetical protein
MTIALPLAHAAHTLVDLAIFSPVVILAIWFVVLSIRDKRKGHDASE